MTIKTQDMLLNNARVGPCYERTRYRPAVEEMLHQERLRTRRSAMTHGVWTVCRLCATLSPITVRVHSHSFAKHILNHRLYRAIGIEQQFVNDLATRAIRGRNSLRVNQELRRAIDRLGKETADQLALRKLLERPLRLSQTERRRLGFVTVRNLGPVMVIPRHETRWMASDFTGPMSWAHRECERIGGMLSTEFDRASILYSRLLTPERRKAFHRQYDLCGVAKIRVNRHRYGAPEPLTFEIYYPRINSSVAIATS